MPMCGRGHAHPATVRDMSPHGSGPSTIFSRLATRLKDPRRLLLFLLTVASGIAGVVLLPSGVENEPGEFVLPLLLILIGFAFAFALFRYAKRDL